MLLLGVQILLETLLTHDLLQVVTAFSLQWQGIIPLELLVQGLDLLVQKVWRKVIKAVGSICVREGNNKRSVEVGLAEDFELVGVLISFEVGSVSLLVQNVQTYT